WMRRAGSGNGICWKLPPLSRETNKPSFVPTKIAPGSLEFVTTALILIGTPELAPFENLISLHPLFSSSVMNRPFHVEAIIQFELARWAGEGCASPSPLLGAEMIGVNGRIAKT